MRCRLFIVTLLFLSACQSGRVITAGGARITPPPRSERPTQVSESTSEQSLVLPAGSTIKVESTPATPSSPSITTTTYTLAKDATQSSVAKNSAISLAETRKPDTTVELHKADLAERRILLYAAIGALALGIAAKSLIPAWPGASTSLFIAAGILGAAWKFSEVPWWAAVAVIGLYVAIAGGYKRGEVDVTPKPHQ